MLHRTNLVGTFAAQDKLVWRLATGLMLCYRTVVAGALSPGLACNVPSTAMLCCAVQGARHLLCCMCDVFHWNGLDLCPPASSLGSCRVAYHRIPAFYRADWLCAKPLAVSGVIG